MKPSGLPAHDTQKIPRIPVPGTAARQPVLALSRQTAAGGFLLIGARLISRVLDLATMLVLARILSPADFGLVAIAMIVISIVEAVLELPISAALVSFQRIEAAHYNTAFTLSLLRGLTLAALVCLAAWPFALFYRDTRILPLVCLLCLAPVARGLTSPRLADFSIKLQFAPDFTMEIAGKVAAFLVAVGIALTSRSYWAIAAGTVVSPLVSTLTSYVLAPYRPKLSLSMWPAFKGFLSWFTAAQAIGALNWQTDRLMLGKLFARADLGLFTTANDTASVPLQAFLGPINRPLLSAFSLVKDQPQRLVQSYLRSATGIVTVGLPILIGESILAHPIVMLLLGPKWSASAPMLRWLALSLAPALFALPMSPLVMAEGKTRIFFQRNLFEVSVKIPLVVFGALRFGFFGVIFARCISETATVFFCMTIVRRLIGVPIHRQLLGPWRSLVAAAAMGSVLLLAAPRFNGAQSTPHLAAELLLVVLSGAVTYGSVLWLLWTAAGAPEGLEAMIASQIARTISQTFTRPLTAKGTTL